MKGTIIYFEQNLDIYEFIRKVFIETLNLYCGKLIHFSALTEAQTFIRSAGSTSDICNKELYSVHNYKNPKLSDDNPTVLKAEGTAPVILALDQLHATFNQYLRVGYFDRMYRYNRPQKYRLRELTQAGVEFFGDSLFVDFDSISCAHTFLLEICRFFGFTDLHTAGITLKINYIGDLITRSKYNIALGEYFINNKAKISEQAYYKSLDNPLRALDKLTEEEKTLLHDLPNILDFQDNKNDFTNLLTLLQQANIPYIIDPFIIRGLDYYSKTVFEFTTTDNTTLLAGGRYDQLVNILIKQDCSGIGWSAGIDRIIQYFTQSSQHTTSSIVNSPVQIHTAHILIHHENPTLMPQTTHTLTLSNMTLTIVNTLRQHKYHTAIHHTTNLTKSLSTANKMHIKWIVIIGTNEINTHMYNIKDMHTGHTHHIPISNIAAFFSQT